MTPYPLHNGLVYSTINTSSPPILSSGNRFSILYTTRPWPFPWVSYLEWPLALLLNINISGISIYRTICLMPSIVPMVASCMLPLSVPVLTTCALFQFLHVWNDFFGPLLYLNDPSKYTLAYGLQQFLGSFGGQWTHLMAGATVFTIPIIILFFLAQKTFIQGISTTGLK
jgi:hypothetical protein